MNLDEMTPHELRAPLVEAMLPHVPFEGWSRAAIDLAAADLSVPPKRAQLAFSGPADMADAFTELADAAMVNALDELELPGMKIRDRIRIAVVTRLAQAEPHKEAVRRAAAVLAMPQNSVQAAKGLWRTVDAMWRAAGDTSTDYNFYTKRAILSAVYSATLLVWLNDDSEDHLDTLAFLDRRIDGIMRFEKTKAKVLGAVGGEGGFDPIRMLGRLRYPLGG